MRVHFAFTHFLIATILILTSISPAAAFTSTSSGSINVELGQPGTSFRYMSTLGVTSEPYLPDVLHLNYPEGMFIDGSDNLFVAEAMGNRLLGYDADGDNFLTIGHGGVSDYYGNYLNSPHEVIKDGDGNYWILMSNAVKEYSPAGEQLLILPADDPWNEGNDNAHFSYPIGIAFDQTGLLFISDYSNHRVQVYSVSGSSLTYVNTLGVTSEPGDDDTHFNSPARIAFDSSNALYVMDSGNTRVQKCTSTDNWVTWSCTKFFGGEHGSDPAAGQMGWAAFGIVIDSTDNVFIADGTNMRVLKCTPAGVCSHFVGTVEEQGNDNNHFDWVSDVAVDSSDQVYVSDEDNARVQVYTGAGSYVKTIGVTEVPYVVDAVRYNQPSGIAAASNGGVYIGEQRGHRLVKINPDGSQAWTVGHAGIFGRGNDYFGGGGLEGNPVETQDGKVYVPDTGNNRIQIFSAITGAYLSTYGEGGQGDNQFRSPIGVTINPLNQDILVADRDNHRVQVYTSAWVYKTRMGVTGVPGSDNSHFNSPQAVTVDSSGAVFVADTANLRVQKCTTSNGTLYTCTTFAGITGEEGDDFDHLHPVSVAVDKAGRVYLTDNPNNRVQVFDANGAYLTTIGGTQGTLNGVMINPVGVTVDKDGNVYIADTDNQRIQKLTPGVRGWRQVNINGFGNAWHNASCIEVFNDQLYAATAVWTGVGGRVYRSSTGTDWAPTSEPGFGDGGAVTAIIDLAVFDGKLYASTGWGGNGSVRIYRTEDGSDWEEVVSDGFGVGDNAAVVVLIDFEGWLYAGVQNSSGIEIWRSATGNSTDWTQVVSGGFGDIHNGQVGSFVEFSGWLYAGINNDITGNEVWRTNNGTVWEQVYTDGFGDARNIDNANLQVFNDQLYVAMRNDTLGAQIWRSDNGTTWEQVVADGFMDAGNYNATIFAFDGYLYAFARHIQTGVQIWRSPDGINWHKAGTDGFGHSDSNLWWNNNITIFNDHLYVATWSYAGQIWEMQETVFLPMVKKQ